VVDCIITEMGVIRVTRVGLILEEIAPDVTVQEVQAATEPTLYISERLKPMF
jgi:acyl CoA:acetate/3-ketoacid CoA transferase beta subunit